MGWLGAIFGAGSPSDERAMEAVRRTGDAGAFAVLVKRWEGPIGRLCARMAGEERGENLAQETFVRVFARRVQYAEGKRFSTWVWQIAVNVCREEWRKAERRGEVSLGEREVHEREPGPAEWAEARERAVLVQEALAGLPEREREVVILREYEGLTFREIGEVLGVAEGTVKWRMAEGLSALAKRLGPRLGVGRVDAMEGQTAVAGERTATTEAQRRRERTEMM